ncbi:uncharacterized protein B0H18DRAFT_958423 [Fomitopsis serialis]|uniref:uncharacterized protein n=1 Tax=Fomitopsis serialis TaxID=139415 RepID=UPI00200754CD|nr:uncharacterized protein B0H18DRAFT_958423 [Neoantrodia serialis]KAH9917351.1 hypothetical protein B0H18DRAFT_958423 [Neoantrodia serialis]
MEDYYWVIDMPKSKEGAGYGVTDEEAGTFVLYKGLNLERGEVIRGRATRIWKARSIQDLVLPQEERRYSHTPPSQTPVSLNISLRALVNGRFNRPTQPDGRCPGQRIYPATSLWLSNGHAISETSVSADNLRTIRLNLTATKVPETMRQHTSLRPCPKQAYLPVRVQ